MTTQEKYTKHIVEWLEARPYISVNGLEKAANVPQYTIAKARTTGRLIPTHSIFPIMFELAKCGITDIDGFTLTADEETFCIFGKKQIGKTKSYDVFEFENGEKKSFEITEDYDSDAVMPLVEGYKSNYIDYVVHEGRTLYTNWIDMDYYTGP